MDTSFAKSMASPCIITQRSFSFQDRSPTCVDFYVHNELKLSQIRRKLMTTAEDPLTCLKLVDTVHKLGIECHFQDEVNKFMERHYTMITEKDLLLDRLFDVSLSFRLLRQQGYYVTANVFNNIQISKDINELMSLFEASHLSVEGEDVLEEAGNISRRSLNEIVRMDSCENKSIIHTLRYPYHKSLVRSTIKGFIKFDSVYFGVSVCDLSVLQELVKADFDMVQSIHQTELLEISRWWKELGLGDELKFVRNQPIKWHMWSIATLTNPSMSKQRIELTKPTSLIYIIDDIFDVYGNLDELILFSQAVNKWDVSSAKQLPDYMKICFNALYDVTNEISCKVYQDYGWNPVVSLRKAWGSLIDAFLVEAKWFASGYVPKPEEYLRNGIVSSGVNVVLVHMFFLLGGGANKENAKIIEDYPEIINCVAAILRLSDDLGSAKDENQDGNDGSYITCFMKEHTDLSKEEARQHVHKMISNAWKRLNKEWLLQNRYSTTFKKACMNLARMVSLMYTYDENQNLPQLEHYMDSVL